ncbi:hypothetical protein ACL02U_23000 [Streptomyces sp. MS06]|uniref:hypothetical protein n=1 Tax=Streptomyces sp. MS06 TaxID=3385974 RepID=UPI0039A03ACB
MGMGSDRTPGEALAALRRTSLGIAVVLVVEYGFGMWVNSYDGRPPTGNGMWNAFGHALTSTPAALVIHAWLGLVIVGGALHTLMTARGTNRPLLMGTSVFGLLCMVGAALSGAAFVDSGKEVRSLSMALFTGAALICYLINSATTSSAHATAGEAIAGRSDETVVR